ncbi:MAG: hypothetical protein R3B60_02910 [Candidatus Paceibacterota bacterium]
MLTQEDVASLTKKVGADATRLNSAVLSYLEARDRLLDNLISIVQCGLEKKISTDIVIGLVKKNKTILLFLFQKMECDRESFNILVSTGEEETLKAIKKWLIELRKVNNKRINDINNQ